MRTYTFPAVLERGQSCFGVFFPDLSGCVSVGDTFTEAGEMAREALSLHLSGMIEDGLSIPEPSDPATWERDPEVNQVGVIIVSAPAGPVDNVELMLSPDLLKRVDRTALLKRQTRERVLTEGVEQLFAAE